MARIRSIKPEFWTDGKIRRLSGESALFFIALWTFADDFGFFPLDTLELASKTSRWRAQEVFKLCSALVGAGLVRCSSVVGVGQVVSWDHQKIKDRRLSKWNDLDIEWDNVIPNARGSDKIRLGVERRGEERSGEDLLKPGSPAPPVPAPKAPKKSAPNPANKIVWESFRSAYVERYHVEPIRNAKVNSAISQFVARVGEDDSPAIISFYVHHNDSFYVRNMHAVSLALRDAESLRTQWLKGHAVTQADVRRFERNQEHLSLMQQIDREGV